jgi:hypothetical protein
VTELLSVISGIISASSAKADGVALLVTWNLLPLLQ